MYDRFAKFFLSYDLLQSPCQPQQGNKKFLMCFQLEIGTRRLTFYGGWIDIFFPLNVWGMKGGYSQTKKFLTECPKSELSLSNLHQLPASAT